MVIAKDRRNIGLFNSKILKCTEFGDRKTNICKDSVHEYKYRNLTNINQNVF